MSLTSVKTGRSARGWDGYWARKESSAAEVTSRVGISVYSGNKEGKSPVVRTGRQEEKDAGGHASQED